MIQTKFQKDCLPPLSSGLVCSPCPDQATWVSFIVDLVVGGVLWLGMVTMMMIDNDDAVGLWLLDEKIQSENLRRTTMTTTSQAVCAPTDVCRKRQEPRSPARSRFPGVEGGGLLLFCFPLVSDFINDVHHVVNWQGGFSPCFENPLWSPFRCGEVVAEASFELSRSKSSFCWGLTIHWDFETFDNPLKTSTILDANHLRQLRWSSSKRNCEGHAQDVVGLDGLSRGAVGEIRMV